MTITNGYMTLDELRAAHVPPNLTSVAADARYESVIEAASRAIDNKCRRRFFGVAETRYYTADERGRIFIDDLTSITALKTDDDGDGTFETTWQAADYHLYPYNAALDSEPYTQIETSGNGTQDFPVAVKKGVLVQGVFGYVAGTQAATACPDPIHRACELASLRFIQRKDTAMGRAGNQQLGERRVAITQLDLDPDIVALLRPFIRQVR